MNTQKSKEGTFSPLEIETKMNRWTHTIAYVFMPSVFLRQRTRIPSSLPNSVTARITLCRHIFYLASFLLLPVLRKIPTPSHGAMATTDDSSVAYTTPVFSPSNLLLYGTLIFTSLTKSCSTQLNPPTNSYNSFQLIGITQTGLNELFTGYTHLL